MNPSLAIETAKFLTGQSHECMFLDGYCMICKEPEGLREWYDERNSDTWAFEKERERDAQDEYEAARQRGETGGL